MSTVNRILKQVVDVLGSFGLAIILLLFLFVLTGFGTWEQKHMSIYDVQNDYFESLIVVPTFFPIPLPGAYLILSLLFVNLIVGGMIRIRKRASTVGVIIAHFGIALLLVGGMIEFKASTKGTMLLFPGDVKGAFESYFDWDVNVTEVTGDRSGKEYVIPAERFRDLDAGDPVVFTSKALPFDVVLHSYQRNAVPVSAPNPDVGVDGFMLKALAPADPAEHNLPGIYVALREPGGTEHKGLLFADQNGPFLAEVGGRRFSLSIDRRQWPIPFELGLERFVKEEHPRTGMAREFSSYVQKIEGGVSQDIHITMNEPLRHRGFTFYQSQYQTDQRTGRVASVLAVVENPADRVPEYATWIIALGLFVHFVRKLLKHIDGESRRRSHDAA